MQSEHIAPMTDADHAPRFWRSVSASFKHNHRVVFDLYNEPHAIGWSCWRNGCRWPGGDGGDGNYFSPYRIAGMQSLVDAVRSTGARQPLMLGGIQWSSDISQWRAYRPHDPLHQLVASQHGYGPSLSPCWTECRSAVARVARKNPVVVGEFGDDDCARGYIDGIMPFFDAHGISYLGWTWDSTDSGWPCDSGPALIKDYAGTPSPYGVGLRDHLRAIR
jgi:hypothetical protein